MKKKLKNAVTHYRTASFIIITTLALALYALQPAFILKFSLGIDDLKFAVRSGLNLAPKPRDNVVIVTVDEKSVNELGRWLWPRKTIGDLFYNLSEASIVALDIVFSEHSTEEEDLYLADSIMDADNIILGFFFRDRATQSTTDETIYYLENCAYRNFSLVGETTGVQEFPYVETNIPIIAESGLSCASFSTLPDADGLYRKYPLAYIHQGLLFPSLAVQTLRYHMNTEAELVLDKDGVRHFEMGDIDLNTGNYFRLNYYDEHNVAYISAVDVIKGRVKPEYFKGKIVVVGVTEAGIYDMRPTPIDPVTPGVSLHYVAVNNLLNQEYLTSSKKLDYALIIFSLSLVLAVSFIRKQGVRLASYLLAVFATLALSYSLFFFGRMWQQEFFALMPAVILFITLEAFAFFKTELRALEIKKAFSSYVSPALVEEILQDPDRLLLGGEERDISIIFSDIRGFTTLSESLTAPKLVSMLNRIHDPMTKVILEKRGMLDKYIGDAMMCLFNTPLDLEDHADRAVESALEIIRTLHRINETFKAEGVPEIDVGVGLNSGVAVCGNMGSTVRFEYTAIGDSVNLASRLEGLCKVYKCRIVLSEFTVAKLKGDFLLRRLDKVRVKGKHEPVTIYEAMEDTEDNRRIKSRFDEAFEKYLSQDFAAAVAIFDELDKTYKDATSQVFVERCELFIETPPEDGWDGVFTLKSK